MAQAGVASARADIERARRWVDFGIDESWEPAARRPRALSELPVAGRSRVAERPVRSVAAAERPVRRVAAAEQSPRPRAASSAADRPARGAGARAVRAPLLADPGPAAPPAARRTVTIRGRGAERDLAFPSAPRGSRRPATRRHERPGFRPDRMAMWAVLLGVLLVLVAATSSHAAVRGSAPAAAPAHHAAASGYVRLVAPA